jgi:hypothetical protein
MGRFETYIITFVALAGGATVSLLQWLYPQIPKLVPRILLSLCIGTMVVGITLLFVLKGTRMLTNKQLLAVVLMVICVAGFVFGLQWLASEKTLTPNKIVIDGKLLSQYWNIGRLGNGQHAALFVHKLSIYSRDKDIPLKTIEVYLKFPGINEIKCRTQTWRTVIFTWPDRGRCRLNIDRKDDLSQLTFLPKGPPFVGYLSFSCEHFKDEKFDYVKYVLVDTDNRTSEINILQKDIDSNTQLFDDRIWIPIR